MKIVYREDIEIVRGFGGIMGMKRFAVAERKVDAMAAKLGVFPGSNIARQVVEGMLTEEEGFERARKINTRHQQTRYDELLAKGYCREDARELIATEVGDD